MALIFARDLSIDPNSRIEIGVDGLDSASGNFGYVVYGPRISVEGGVYLVELDMDTYGPIGPNEYWDVYADDQILSVNRLDKSSSVIHIHNTLNLEFRIHVELVRFKFRSVKLTPLMLDKQPSTCEELSDLAALATRYAANITTLFYLATRLDNVGSVKEGAELRRRALDAHSSMWMHDGPASDPVQTEFKESLDQLSEQPITIFNAYSGFTPRQVRDLRLMGYSPAAFEAICIDHDAGEPSRYGQGLKKGGVPDADLGLPDFIRRLYRHDLTFQTYISRTGRFASYCPNTGERVYSQHGFCLAMGDMPYIFYRFDASEVFYICVGSWAGMKMFAYMPRTATVIVLQDSWFSSSPPGFLINVLNENLKLHSSKVDSYLLGDTQVASVVGNNNLGHFLWNDLSGINFALKSDLFSSVLEIVQLVKEHLKVAQVFPELGSKCSERLIIKNTFEYFLDRGLLPVRFTDLSIEDSLAKRIQEQASRRGVGDPPPPPRRKGQPLIWINLRTHNKAWLQQVTGYSNILNEALRLYGGVSAIIDGWSDCAELAQEIRRSTDERVTIYNGLDFTLWDSLNWAFSCDAYISTVGAGLTLVNWVAARPGVAHAERAHMGQLQWWHYVRPTAVPPLAPPISAIQDVGTNDYCNYDLDWKLLFDLLTRALDTNLRPLGWNSAPSWVDRIKMNFLVRRS